MLRKLKLFFRLIKFEHSIFALPFAYLGLFLAEAGWPRPRLFAWVTVAMVAVRTSGMCLNRLIDEPIDARNPRTKSRVEMIAVLTRPLLWALALASASVFVFAASRLNPLCLALAPVPIILVGIYPYLKKITWLSHFVLGTILAAAPCGGWLAGRPEWSWVPGLLAVAVAAWVAGFDLFYALQDAAFDRSERLQSFPVRFGFKATAAAVRVLHGVTVVALAALGAGLRMGLWYWAAWIFAAALIVREHRLVARFGLGKINEAFFTMNALVSVVVFAGVAFDLLVF